MEIILASQSPRRKQLLKMLDIQFTMQSSGVDESTMQIDKSSPQEYCESLAAIKADAVSTKHQGALVIGGDTIVVLGSEIIEKPEQKTDAVSMLKQLSGNTHQVYTGISLRCISKDLNHTFSDRTDVTFQNLTDEEIHYYVKYHKPYDKAGSYGIQDWSAVFVTEIKGCFYNVVGFPIPKFYNEIKKLEIDGEIFEKHLNTKRETP